MERLILVILMVTGCSPRAPTGGGGGGGGGGDSIPIAGHVPYVPAGFTVNSFAQNLGGVRFLALGPGGAVYATQSGSGQIVRLVDANGDGVAESVAPVLTGLSDPSGIAFRGDTLYFAVGSSCNSCDDAPPRAAVTRYNLDGSGAHTFATGLRNSVGLAFHPSSGELWANNNDRDYLGDDLPPEHLNILKDGKWYGWPQCYLPNQPNPEYPSANCAGVEPPALTVQAHSAPLGLTFYTGTKFPAEYQGDAFMTYHGSWNRSVPTGAKVVRVRVLNGRPNAVEDFVTGWQLADGSRWGRPVHVVTGADGALLISDDVGGRIWRVGYGK